MPPSEGEAGKGRPVSDDRVEVEYNRCSECFSQRFVYDPEGIAYCGTTSCNGKIVRDKVEGWLVGSSAVALRVGKAAQARADAAWELEIIPKVQECASDLRVAFAKWNRLDDEYHALLAALSAAGEETPAPKSDSPKGGSVVSRSADMCRDAAGIVANNQPKESP